MSQAREAFLARVRQAVATGNRAGTVPPLPSRRGIGYQGCGTDPVQRFQEQFQAAGGHVHIVLNRLEAAAKVEELVGTQQPRSILLGCGELLDSLRLGERLAGRGMGVTTVDKLEEETGREMAFAADLGISDVAALIAETGSLVMYTGSLSPRSLSLLPPVHVAVATREQIVPDLFDLFDDPTRELPSCLTLITGPSKTGDIELCLVTGVHGPGEVHVVLL